MRSISLLSLSPYYERKQSCWSWSMPNLWWWLWPFSCFLFFWFFAQPLEHPFLAWPCYLFFYFHHSFFVVSPGLFSLPLVFFLHAQFVRGPQSFDAASHTHLFPLLPFAVDFVLPTYWIRIPCIRIAAQFSPRRHRFAFPSNFVLTGRITSSSMRWYKTTHETTCNVFRFRSDHSSADCQRRLIFVSISPMGCFIYYLLFTRIRCGIFLFSKSFRPPPGYSIYYSFRMTPIDMAIAIRIPSFPFPHKGFGF